MADAAQFNMIVSEFLTRQKAKQNKAKQSKAKQSKRKQKQHKHLLTKQNKKKKATQTKQIICVLIRNLGLIVFF